MNGDIDIEIFDFDMGSRRIEVNVDDEVEIIRNELLDYYSKDNLDYPGNQIRIETIKNASALGVMEMRLLQTREKTREALLTLKAFQTVLAEEMVDVLSNHINNENELCLRRKINNEKERD